MIDFFKTIGEILSTVMGYVFSMLKGLWLALQMAFHASSIATAATFILPPFVVGFALAFVALSLVYMIIRVLK